MMNLTFGEQVKVILGRKGMTIKELAEEVEKYTGKPMSRQNMTQRLGRDNFQEQDMRMIAEILGCQFTLSIMESPEMVPEKQPAISEGVLPSEEETIVEEVIAQEKVQTEEKEILRKGIKGYFQVHKSEERKPEVVGDINPYTQKEYESNSVRIHPSRIGYVQVYSREQHKWTDMTEWAFLGEQERKKVELGKDYKPPVYLD